MKHQKEITEILRALQDAKLNPGWRVVDRKGGHPVAYPPDKTFPPITIQGSPGDYRGIKNLRMMLKRAGAKGVDK